jgi:hypothetical protein
MFSILENNNKKLTAFSEASLRLSLRLLKPTGEVSMQVVFESRDAEGTQMRDLSVDRVRFALRRLGTVVARAKVQFSDVNGPRGGVDKRCQVEVQTDSVGTVVIASLARDWRTALDRSLARITRVLRRSLQRNLKPSRKRASKIALNS